MSLPPHSCVLGETIPHLPLKRVRLSADSRGYDINGLYTPKNICLGNPINSIGTIKDPTAHDLSLETYRSRTATTSTTATSWGAREIMGIPNGGANCQSTWHTPLTSQTSR